MIDVYLATSPSGKGYVGYSTQGAATRWTKHVRAARNGSPAALHRAIRKYGADAFTLDVIDRVSTLDGAHRAERAWIRELGTLVRGYNLTAGGEGCLGRPSPMLGRKHSAQTIERMRAASLGQGPNKGRTGQTCSTETLAKMRAAHAGRRPDAAIAAITGKPSHFRGKTRPPETRERMRAAWRLRREKAQ
jgi:group I intron endonuclease